MAASAQFPRFAFAAVALLALAAEPAAAEPCRGETFEDNAYIVCSFDLTKDDVRLFWGREGKAYGTFDALADDLGSHGLALEFAMNGGMYGENLAPIGLYVEEGKERHRANRVELAADVKPVPNFYKKPNGVFYIGPDGGGVTETARFLEEKPAARFATQSGPMLVIDGAIHPAFIEGSNDRKQRNGVGMSSPTEVHFVISDGVVNFHDFARFFRDRLGCPSALFLDGGTAPGIFAPELDRDDPPGHGGYGPIIAVVGKRG